ncbi:MAG TPA: S-adenosylmethionine decarboxylase [Gemmatimonadaceae bacterium]|nr:S-adenosylmethionine decarboxylase [Gemmatimonadaceae bacterium]
MSFIHALADLSGIAPGPLRDPSLLGGLLIAAAGALGVATAAPPTVRQQPDDSVNAMLLLDGCHIAVHTVPARGLLMLDVLAPEPRDVRRAIDVFSRRLAPRSIAQEERARG